MSKTDQNPQLQLDALHEAGAVKVFTDHGVSGAKTSRPELDACLEYLRPNDTLAVWKLDRLGRSTRHVLEVIDQLHERGIGFRSLTEGITTEGAMGKAMLTILAAFAELERSNLIERTRAGLAAAAANNRKGGRRPTFTEEDIAKAREYRSRGMSAQEVAKLTGMSRASVYRLLAESAEAEV